MGYRIESPARVVCGVSESPSGGAVGEFSRALSESLGAELVLVHVAASSNPRTDVPPGLPFDPGTYRSGALARGVAVLEQHAGPALRNGARGRVELGDPVTRLLEVVSDEGASLLVLGWRGRRFFSRPVSGRLLRRSECPVVFVPLNHLG